MAQWDETRIIIIEQNFLNASINKMSGTNFSKTFLQNEWV